MNAKLKKFFLTMITTIIVAFCTLLAACGEIGAVDQSTIKYDGSVITWGAVEDAENYTIQIDGEKEYTSSTNKFAYKVKADVEQVEITITANGKDKSGESASKIFTRLPKIETKDIKFDETGKMSWPEVEGANEYILKINGKEIRVASTEYNEFAKGVNKIQVKPIALDDSSFSEWSTEVSKDYLVEPSNIKYDGQYLTWTGIGKSARYAIYINGSHYDSVEGTVVEYDAQNNNFDVTVKTLGDKVNTFDSEECEASSFIFLGEVTGFNVVDGILRWEAVEGAQGYAIRVNGKEKNPVEKNFYDEIEAGIEIRIEVKPITAEGTAYFANWSQPEKVKLLSAPSLNWNGGLNLDGQVANFVYWNVMEGDVAGYNFKVANPDGTEDVYTLGPDITQFGAEQNVTFTDVGDYEISIQTIAQAATGAYSSEYSDPIQITRLRAPKQDGKLVQSHATSIKDGITIKWEPVTAAAGYAIYKDDALLRDNHTNATININYQDLLSEEDTDGKQITFQIQALGTTKYFGTERRINLSSLKSENLKAEVTILAQPKNITFAEYTAKWATVPTANGYAVKCVGDAVTTEVAEYDLMNLEAGQATLSVCATGDGGHLLASNYTSGVRIVRLQAPTNIRLKAAEDGDILEWNEAGNTKASHYSVFWSGTETEFATSKQIINMKDFISEGSDSVFMRAIANYLDTTTNTYYVTSKASLSATFTKLAAPIFNTETVDGNYLVWNAPSNVGSTLDIRYRVYNDNIRQDKIVDDNKFDLSTYPSGSYSFTVVAYSDNGQYISSDFSPTPAAFEKLATPDVKREGAAYTWAPVNGALGYYAVYGDKTKTLSASETSFEPGFIEPKKTYTVSVYAVGDKGVTAMNSAAWEDKAQRTERARTPEFSLSYEVDGEVATQHKTGGKIVVTITYESNYTYDYEIKIGGISYTLKGDEAQRNGDSQMIYEHAVDAPGEYLVEVYAKGGMFGNDPDKTYYVKSASDAAQKIVIQNAVSVPDITQSSITWKYDSLTPFGYTVKVTLKNGQEIEMKVPNKTIYYTDLGLEDVKGNPLTDVNGNELTVVKATDIFEVEVIVNGGKNSSGLYITSKEAYAN